MTIQILDALRAAVDAKAAYWDRMHELEAALGCEDPPDRVNNHLVDYVDGLAFNVDVPGDVEWIDGVMADEMEAKVRELQAREGNHG
jgi:hypothetical protein